MEAIGERGEIDVSFVRPVDEVNSGYTQFFDGDVVVAKITPCFENGKGALVKGLLGGIGFGTTELHVLTPSPGLDGRFLYYITASPAFRRLGEASMTGAAGQKRVTEDFVRDFRISVPPIAHQRAIADYLDRETARLDALVAAKERVLGLLAEKRRALITRAVTRGLDPRAPLRDSGIPWLGEIPVHWTVKKLAFLASLKSGDSITADDIKDDGPYPVYGGNGLRGYTDRFTHDGEYPLIGRQGALCGNINYATGQFWASEHAVVVAPREEIAVRWLGELLRAMDLNQYSVSAAQPGLSVETIAALRVPLPPQDTQLEIIGYVAEATTRLDALRMATGRSIALLRERRAALIAAAVTGQIDTGAAL